MRIARPDADMSYADFCLHMCTICGTLCNADRLPANQPKMRIFKIKVHYIPSLIFANSTNFCGGSYCLT